MRMWHRILGHSLTRNVERYDVTFAGRFTLPWFVDQCSCGKAWVS